MTSCPARTRPAPSHLARDLCETGRALHEALRRVRELEAEVARLTALVGILRGVA